MKILTGLVKDGHNVATANLMPILGLIAQRMDMPALWPGTLNVGIEIPYVVRADCRIEKYEYNGLEFLKLQRCRIEGVRALIMRPNTHEEGQSHGLVQLEIMASAKLRDLLKIGNGDVVLVEVEGTEEWWRAG